MAGPFPGMNPYIESQGHWQDFHTRAVVEVGRRLAPTLPEPYIARVETMIELISTSDDDLPLRRAYKPDALVARDDAPFRPADPDPDPAATGVLEPLLVAVDLDDSREFSHHWIEIRTAPQLELVTVVEVLSPVNKAGASRGAYVEKRADLLRAGVALVEIDLLLGGLPVPTRPRLPRGALHVVVTRPDRLPEAEVYRWTLRQTIPVVPIPLKAPDPDVHLELGELVDAVYVDGLYKRLLIMDRPLADALPLDDDDRRWAEAVGRGDVLTNR